MLQSVNIFTHTAAGVFYHIYVYPTLVVQISSLLIFCVLLFFTYNINITFLRAYSFLSLCEYLIHIWITNLKYVANTNTHSHILRISLKADIAGVRSTFAGSSYPGKFRQCSMTVGNTSKTWGLLVGQEIHISYCSAATEEPQGSIKVNSKQKKMLPSYTPKEAYHLKWTHTTKSKWLNTN